MKNRYIQIFSCLIALLSFATFPACELDDKINFVTEQEPVTKPELTLPKVSNPGAGKTTIVLYIPENTPAGCYAVGDMNSWNVENTEFRFMPVQGVDDKRWVSCTIDYESYMKMKVLAIPNAVNVSLGWEFQWGKNMDSGNDLKEDNVVILDGVGTLLLENQGQPMLCEVADNGVVYIQVKSWATNPPYTPNLLKGSKVWTILVDTVTAQVNASKIVADFGPDDEAGRYLYIWDDSYSVGNNWNGKNFYGVSYDYISLLVGNRGWAGCGFCLTEYDSSKAWEAAEALRTAIVANPDDYYLHMALKSTDNASHCFYIFNTGTTMFTIGSTPINDGPVYANFKRDGEWAEFDIPMSRFATTLATITCEAGMNIFVALSEGISGAQLNMDAIYFFKKADGDNLSVQTTSPTVTTAVVTQITETSAVVGGNVTNDGNASVTERGVVYSTNPNPVITNLNNTIRPCGSGTGEFTYTITGLQSGTTYYVRAYAKNDVGTAYGEEMSFTTKVQATPEYVDLGLSVKWATFNVGASTPEEYGDYFAWGETVPKATYNWSTYKWCNDSVTTLTKYNTDSSHGTVDNKTQLDLNDDAAHVNWGGDWRMPTDTEWTELREQCTWTWTTQNGVKGYKVTSKKVSYSKNSIFLPAAGYRYDSSPGGAGSHGSYWSSSLYSDSPEFVWNVSFDSSDVGRYFSSRNIGYSVRPIYGEKTLPTVTTAVVTQITETSAVAGGNVTSDGGASVTERGVCIATVSNPTTANTKISAGSGTGTFNCNLTNLQPNTKYYVRAYAINTKGTAYGDEVVFTTSKTVVLPTVTTSTITQITETSAVAGGNVTSDGNANVTERGVCISTVFTPTTSNTKVKSGTGTGSFTCNLTGLQPNTRYYVRAYAINSKGTAYGAQVSFTTNKTVVLPTVTTSTVTQITATSAVAGGNVTSDGNANVTERGVCIATVSNPTTANTKISAGSGTGTFNCNLTNLQPNTKYYVRAYAINSKGTAYGTQVTFTTKQIVLPTVTTSTVTQITATSAVAGGTVTNDGNASVTERGVCIATVSNPTTSNTKVSAGSGTGSFTCNLTNLQPNTTYYVRAYAVNSKGTAYGTQVTFTSNGTDGTHEYVDLGLSVKWATMNVGASKPEHYGSYFAWGETQPKDYYDWSTYKWCNGDLSILTKYNTSSSYGTVDNKTTLEMSDDAARANWGGVWRMPTDAEMTELRTNCTWTWTTENGVNGYKVTSKSNGNSIFLPAAGSYGEYWSSSLDTGKPYNAWYVFFDSSRVIGEGSNRHFGGSVRPVHQ